MSGYIVLDRNINNTNSNLILVTFVIPNDPIINYFMVGVPMFQLCINETHQMNITIHLILLQTLEQWNYFV